MRTRGSESFIVLPLLPIFLIGLFPMLLLSLLGPAGLIILGILVASAGLTDTLDANGTFSEQIIVHGYAKGRNARATHGAAFGNALRIRHDRGRRRPCGRRHRRPGAVVRASFVRLRSDRARHRPAHELVACASRKNLSMDMPPAAMPPRAPIFCGNEARGEFKCSNSTSTDRPTRPRSRCSWRKPASPIELVAVDTRKGDQFKPEYLAVNPNAKVPAIDDDGVKVFDSNAILLYLAEKTGKFLPANTPANRAELLSWLMFVATGVGPYSGQAVHFKHFAPEKIDYAHNRYQFEAQRHFGILNDHLANRRYMVGDTYTIVDMDVWGWARMIPFVLGEDAVAKYPNVKRLVDEISARPAAAKAIALKDKFKFKAEMDDEARSNMFRHLKIKAA